jgi:hypothetical protein
MLTITNLQPDQVFHRHPPWSDPSAAVPLLPSVIVLPMLDEPVARGLEKFPAKLGHRRSITAAST